MALRSEHENRICESWDTIEREMMLLGASDHATEGDADLLSEQRAEVQGLRNRIAGTIERLK